jgi:hypothetical protein
VGPRPPDLPLSDAVLIIDISHTEYNLTRIEADWASLTEGTQCPCCQSGQGFVRHGVYLKYHYQQQIGILRVRCRCCGVTHAIIPSFSLPGTSIGIPQAESYLKARAEGESRFKAGRCLAERGLSLDYPRRLERMLEVAVARGKALWPLAGDPKLGGLSWMKSFCGESHRPLYQMNLFSLARGVNCLCFSRSSILLFCRKAVRSGVSHNPGTTASAPPHVESG